MIIEEIKVGEDIIKRERREEFGTYLRDVKNKLKEIEQINNFLYKDRNLLEKIMLSMRLDIPPREKFIERREQLFAEINELNKANIYWFESEFDLGDTTKQKCI